MLFVPETHVPTVLVRKARQKRRETGEERWYAPSEKEHKSFKVALKKSVTTPFSQSISFAPLVQCGRPDTR
jgi:hypothetical protein